MARMSRAEQHAKTRDRLVEAAAKLVARDGYDAVTIDAITEEAGYSRGAFYSNFRTKHEITREAARHAAGGRIGQREPPSVIAQIVKPPGVIPKPQLQAERQRLRRVGVKHRSGTRISILQLTNQQHAAIERKTGARRIGQLRIAIALRRRIAAIDPEQSLP